MEKEQIKLIIIFILLAISLVLLIERNAYKEGIHDAYKEWQDEYKTKCIDVEKEFFGGNVINNVNKTN